MNPNQIERGQRLRQHRQERGMTLRALAQGTGLSVGFLSKIENGVGNPSADNIQKICYALDITVNELMASKNEQDLLNPLNREGSYVLRRDERCLLYDFNDSIRFEALFEGNPAFKLNVMTLNGKEFAHFNTMHGYDEFGIVTKGALDITLNETEEYHLEEGDCIMIRAQTVHTIFPKKGQESVSIWVEMSGDAGRMR